MKLHDLFNFPPKQEGEWVSMTRIHRICPKCNRTRFHWGMREESSPETITAECCHTTECGHKWPTEYIKEEWRD